MKKLILGATFALFAASASAQQVNPQDVEDCTVAANMSIPISYSRVGGKTEYETLKIIHETPDVSPRVRELAVITADIIYSVPIDVLADSTEDEVWDAMYQRCISDMTSVNL